MHLEKLTADMAHVLGIGNGMRDAEVKHLRERLKKEVQLKFVELDMDKNGELCWNEFKELHDRLRAHNGHTTEPHKYTELCGLLERLVRPRSLQTIDFEASFRTLDIDGFGLGWHGPLIPHPK